MRVERKATGKETVESKFKMKTTNKVLIILMKKLPFYRAKDKRSFNPALDSGHVNGWRMDLY